MKLWHNVFFDLIWTRCGLRSSIEKMIVFVFYLSIFFSTNFMHLVGFEPTMSVSRRSIMSTLQLTTLP